MFESLPLAPPDPILGLSEEFRNDLRPEKINLTVGVYQDENGKTPVLSCVKKAEAILLEAEKDKSYVGIAGLREFDDLACKLVFGDGRDLIATGRVATVQTPGGTGALRVAADFMKRHYPGASIWLSKPTWANHPNVFRAAGIETKSYPYLTGDVSQIDFDPMMEALSQAPPGDIVCLHACCHNPSGVDPTAEQWREIADIAAKRKLLPLIDFAYQGFGDGLREDASGLMEVCEKTGEALICSSFSKNFGLYAERVGALTIVAESPQAANAGLSQIKASVRANYSNPPKHGAAIVATILNDATMRAQWEAELLQMRERIRGMRYLFVDTLKNIGVKRDFTFVENQKGMFSFSGLTPLRVDQLRTEHAIYIVGSGRINVAAMTTSNIDHLCEKIASVLR